MSNRESETNGGSVEGHAESGLRDLDHDARTNKAIYEEARDRLALEVEAESENCWAAKADLEFREGAQWDKQPYTTAEAMNQPEITVNLTDALVRRVVNNMKQQRPRGKAHPVGDGADIQKAQIINGIGRHVENRSDAALAYDVGAEMAVVMGWGYWRLIAEYVSPDSFHKDMRLVPIRNTFSVHMDPAATLPTAADANWCIITSKMPRTEYKRLYPHAPNLAFTDTGRSDDRVWEDREQIRLAEYFRIVERRATLCQLKQADGEVYTRYKDELPEPELLAAAKIEVIAERESSRRTVEWYRLGGTEVLEKEVYPGEWIPVIRCEGNAVDIDGKIKRRGMVRSMQDPARMVNYGEPLALDTPIPTPTGWSTIGEVREGDLVLDERGAPASVSGMSPIFIHRECYRVRFRNGESIVADGEHKWTVQERRYLGRGDHWSEAVRSTRELRAGMHYIQAAQPLRLPEIPLPITPYTLGAWLGDGNTSGAQLTQSSADVEEMRELIAADGYRAGAARTYRDRAPVFTVHGLRRDLVRSGLLGRKAIPAAYLRASQAQRLALLQGLMDTDGSISHSVRQCDFGTTSNELAEGFAELIASLGIVATRSLAAQQERLYADGRVATASALHRFTFTCTHLPLFRLKRKASIQRLSGYARRTRRHDIVSVEPCESVPVRCLMVDTPTHLFLCGRSMIPTHNTAKIKRLGLTPQAPWIAAEGQLEGHPEWSDTNNTAHPVLLYKPLTIPSAFGGDILIPPPMRQPPAQIEAGFSEFVQDMRLNLLAVAGMQHDPGIDAQGQVVSGRALRQRQKVSDQSHFQYYDNQTLAIAHTWRIMLQWIPHVYSEDRIQRIIGDDGTPNLMRLNEPVMDPATQALKEVRNDMSVGKYDVVMDTGPGYETRREEGAETLISLLGVQPLAGLVTQVGADLVFRSLDHPYMQELADRITAQTPEGLKKLMEQMPPQAKSVIQALANENGKLKQSLERAQSGLTKAHLDATVKAHDTETRAQTAREDRELQAGVQVLIEGMKHGHDIQMADRSAAQLITQGEGNGSGNSSPG